MANLKFLERNINQELRNVIVDIITKSNILLRKNEIDYIINLIENNDIIESFIPSDIIEPGSIFDSRELNRRLESAYLDFIILYKRLENVIDGIKEERLLRNNRVISLIQQIESIESKIDSIIRSQNIKGLYNTIHHNTFNTNNNYEGSDRKLSINIESGTLRLDSKRKTLSTKEQSNLRYEILTSGIEIIDETPIDNLYDNNPWYVSLISRTKLRNKNYSNIKLKDYPGIVFLVRIQFPAIIQVNRLLYNIFSTDILDLLGLFTSLEHNKSLNSQSLTSIDISEYINRPDKTMELNIHKIDGTGSSIINASEIILVLGQQDYIEINNDNIYEPELGIDELTTNLFQEANNQRISKYGLETQENKNQLFSKEAIDRIRSIKEIKDGDRNYVIGLSKLIVQSVLYEPFGVFETPVIKTNGNVVGFNLDVVNKFVPLVEGIEKYKIKINEREIPIAIIDKDGYVKDSSLIRLDSATGRFVANTSFIPELSSNDFVDNYELYIDSIKITNQYTIDRRTENGYKVFIDHPSAREGGLLTMYYKPSQIDHNGSVYHPDRIDIIKKYGKPNIDINFIPYNTSEYIFVQDSNVGSISYLEGTEIVLGTINNKQFGVIDKSIDKGLQPVNYYTPTTDEADLFDTTNFWYIEFNKLTDVQNELYILLKNRFLKDNSGQDVKSWNDILSNSNINSNLDSITLYTQYDYAKNLIILEVDGVQYKLRDEHQYSIDTIGNIKTKNIINIPKEWIENSRSILVHYHPLFVASDIYESNILKHNDSELFSITDKSNSITLTRSPYVDIDIIDSIKWNKSRGIYYRLDNFSVSYEPISIYVKGEKAINTTLYSKADIKESFPDSVLTYEITGKTITFNRQVEDIRVEYYFIGDSFTLNIEMFKGDASKYYTTPEIRDYTIYMAVK